MKHPGWWIAWGACALMGGAGQLAGGAVRRREALADASIASLLLAANVAASGLLFALPFLLAARFFSPLRVPAALALGGAALLAFAGSAEETQALTALAGAQWLLASLGAGLCVLVWGDRRVLGGRTLADVVLYAGPWLSLSALAALWFLVWGAGSRGPVVARAAVAACLAAAFGAVLLARREGARAGVSLALAAAVTAALAGVAGARQRREVPPAAAAPDAACGVLLTIDTLRADTLRPYEPTAAAHPNLEALLAQSVVFAQARSPAPWTKPAFASMLSGLPLHAHRATEIPSRVPEAVEMLAERLRRSGLVTLAVGDNPVLGARFGFAQGFDSYRMYPQPSLGISLAARIAQQTGLYQPTVSSEALTDLAIDALRRHGSHAFFLWLHYFDPHTPYAPPEAYRPADAPPPGMSHYWNDTHEARAGFVVRTPAERRWLRELYDAEVRYVDAQVGRFLAALRESGAWDRCVIVFASDHGEEFWEHAGFSHGHALYEESIRVPFAIRAPGLAPGRVETSVSTQSLAPTLLELMGLPADGPGMAASLAPLARDPRAAFPEQVVISGGGHIGSEKTSVVQRGRKTIDLVGRSRTEVYDLASDPHERTPLADAEGDVSEARRAIAAWVHEGEAARPDGAGPSSVVLEGETQEQLRALGYAQ